MTGVGKKIAILVLALLAALSAFSCRDSVDYPYDESPSSYDSIDSPSYGTVSGTIVIHGMVPQLKRAPAASRRAVPAAPSQLVCTVEATNGSSTVNAAVTKTAAGYAFNVTLEAGTWDFVAHGYADAAKTVEVFTGSATAVAVPSASSIDIIMSPKSGGTGDVSLPITVTADSGIKSAKVSFDPAMAGAPSSLDYTSALSQTLGASGVASGAYKMRVDFYGGAGGTGDLLYAITESVNVVGGMTTDAFDDAVYVTGGVVAITKPLVDTFKATTFYVRATGNDSTGTGSYFAPFASMGKAWQTVNGVNDGTSKYTIYVGGTISGANACAAIQSAGSLTLNIESETSGNATLDASGTGQVMLIDGSGIAVTVKDVNIKGGNSASDGGGVCIASCKSAVFDGCEIIGNSAGGSGGGVYAGGGKASFTDCLIDTNTSNAKGGGVHINGSGADVTFVSCSIDGNKCNKGGSGDGGAGVRLEDGKASFTDCAIENNGDNTSDGGGLYISAGSATVTGGTVKGNKAKYGGGIRVNGGTFTADGGAEISSNTSSNSGGGLSISSGTVNIEGGVVISGNSVASPQANGGGIYASGGNLNINGTASNRVTISGNRATGTGGNGGGINLGVTGAKINGVLFDNNEARGNGGGFIVTVGSKIAEFKDNTFTGNTADGNGGGAYFSKECFYVNTSTSAANNLTLSGNIAGGKGNGAYVCAGAGTGSSGSLSISGNVTAGSKSNSNDDIYLQKADSTAAPATTEDAYIRVYAALGSTSNINVTPENTAAGTAVVKGTAGVVTSSMCSMFHLLPDSSALSLVSDSTKANGIIGAAAEFYVSANGNDANPGTQASPFASMGAAVNAVLQANDGTTKYTIHVSGEITGTNAKVDLSSNVTSALNLTIQGKNKANDKLNRGLTTATSNGQVIKIGSANATVTISGLTITGGNTLSTDRGAGIFVDKGADVTITDCAITGNKSGDFGGGLSSYFWSNKVKLIGTSITGNTGKNGAGIHVATGNITLEDCTITGNAFPTGASGTQGKGVSLEGGTLNIKGGTKIGSAADDNDIYLGVNTSSVSYFATVTDTLPSGAYINITPKTAAAGTAVVKAGAGHTLTQSDCDKFHITGGPKVKLDAANNQGVLEAAAEFYVSANGDDTTGNGSAAKPYASMDKAVKAVLAANATKAVPYTIYVNGSIFAAKAPVNLGTTNVVTKALDLTIAKATGASKATLDGNNAHQILYIASPNVTLKVEDVYIVNGDSTSTAPNGGYGGGVYVNNANVTLKNCNIKYNKALYGGGGVSLIGNGKLNIEGTTTITGNTVTSAQFNNGGGIYCDTGTVAIKGTCTIEGNTAKNGAGVYIGKGFTVAGTLNAEGCTIKGNTGSGLSVSGGGTATLKNCTVTGNTNSGVYVYSDSASEKYTVTLDGTEVTGNTKNKNGAVMPDNMCIETNSGAGSGTFTVKGATKVGSSTDTGSVYLTDMGTHITVGDALTGAYINVGTGYDNTVGNQILEAASGVTINSALCGHFHLLNSGNRTIVPDSTGRQGVVGTLTMNLTNLTVADINNLTFTPGEEYTFTGTVDEAKFKAVIANTATLTGAVDLDFSACNGSAGLGVGVYYTPIITKNVTSLKLPKNTNAVPQGLCKGNATITEVEIGTGTTEIGMYAFAEASSLASVKLPSTIEQIGNKAFWGTAISSITLPSSVTRIGSEAFYGCAKLTTVDMGNTQVTEIGGATFSQCSKLASVILPSALTKIDSQAFKTCTALTSITLPASVTEIGDEAFHGCSALSNVSFQGTKAQWGAITKGTDWRTSSAITAVNCTDGPVTL